MAKSEIPEEARLTDEEIKEAIKLSYEEIRKVNSAAEEYEPKEFKGCFFNEETKRLEWRKIADAAYKKFEQVAIPLIEKRAREKLLGNDRPKIICLCGSTRFVDTFNEWRKRLTLEGNIIVSIELVLPQSEREDPQHHNFKVKQALDELHLQKIDLADEVMILNVGGYIGESTSKEIAYAQKLGKPIKYLEALKGGK